MFAVLFDSDWLGGKPLLSWTVFALIGFWAGYFSLRSNLLRVGISGSRILIFGILCAGAWFTGAYAGFSFSVGRSENSVLISQGGMHLNGFILYGGVVALLSFGYLLWKLQGWSRFLTRAALWDVGALSMAWALAFGRIGCFLYGCCYGTPNSSPVFPSYRLHPEHWDTVNRSFPEHLRGVDLHPSPLYEAMLLILLGVLGGDLLRRKKLRDAEVGWLIWSSYAVGRFGLEWIRLDPRGPQLYGLWPSQWVSLAFILSAGFAFFWIRRPQVQ